jgi:hypothetical protein
MQQLRLPLQIEPLMSLAEIERLLVKTRAISPVPCRHTLIAYCEDGTLDGRQLGRKRTWYVTEKSVVSWLVYLQTGKWPEGIKLITAA